MEKFTKSQLQTLEGQKDGQKIFTQEQVYFGMLYVFL